MFPLPATLTERMAVCLQGIVTGLATQLLQLFLPAYREGNFIHLPDQQLEVGEACSGLRQIVAFAALTLIVAHASRRSLLYKVGLLLSCGPVAVSSNLLRVLLMAFILRHFGAHYILGACHDAWGLVTMAVGLALLLGVGWWFRRLLPERGDASRAKETEEIAQSNDLTRQTA